MQIRNKLIFSILPLIIVGFIIFTVINLIMLKSNFQDLIYIDLDNVATAQKYMILQIIKDDIEKFNILASNYSLLTNLSDYHKKNQAQSLKNINDIIGYAVEKSEAIDVMNIVDLNNLVLASNDPKLLSTSYDDFPMDQVETSIKVNLFSLENGKIIRSIAGPLIFQNTLLGVLDLDLPDDYIAAAIYNVNRGLQGNNDNLESSGETFLVKRLSDKQQMILLRVRKVADTIKLQPGIINNHDKSYTSLNQLLDGAMQFFIDFNGKKSIAIVKNIPDFDWAIVSFIEESTAFEQIHKIQKYIITGLLFIIFFISLILILLSKSITTPLRNLTNTMRKYDQEGILDDFKVGGSEEINILAKVLSNTVNKLEMQIDHDLLTGLGNRRYFNKEINIALSGQHEENYKFALLFIFIAGIKTVNETLGHNFGDKLVIEIADRLRQFVNTKMRLARFLDNQFVIILYDYDSEDDLAARASIIINLFIQPFVLQGQAYKIDVNVGISQYTKDAANAKDLLQCADNALFVAKKTNPNTYKFYDKELGEQLQHQQRLKGELLKALREKSLEMYFQPQVDISINKIVGVEALIRWKHPIAGFINPAEFVELAEKNNLIHKLTDLAITNSCEALKSLYDNGIKLDKMSINLSAKDFEREDLVKSLLTHTEHFGVSPQHIALEITESLFMHDLTWVVSIISQLKSLGFMIALDDFGKGFSSLTMLNKLPIDIMKIDKAFVDDIFAENNSQNIILIIIDLAHHLNKKIVAEGVETVEQVNWLKSHGCTVFQGYYFAKPMPLSELIDFYKKFNA